MHAHDELSFLTSTQCAYYIGKNVGSYPSAWWAQNFTSRGKDMCMDLWAKDFTSIIEVKISANEVKIRAFEVKSFAFEVKIRAYEVKS